jgi:hypothetical protein
MLKSKYRKIFLLSIIIQLTTAFTIFADNSWLLLHKGKNGKSDVYYNKETAKQIDNNITEVYIQVIFSNRKYSIQQTRVDCVNKKTATGLVDLYVDGIKTQRFDYSNDGWMWLDPLNEVDNKLLQLLCKRHK